MVREGRLSSCLVSAALAVSLAACGSDSVVNPPPVTPPPATPPPPQVVAQQAGVSVPVGYAFGAYFDIAATGTIDATVDYTYGDTLMLIWLAKGRCTEEAFDADQCQYVATSFSGGKPRKVSASGQAAGTYTLVFGSLGPQDESVSYQVVFTQTATTGGVPAAATRRPAEPGFLTRLPASARP
jgi:hypothetical protein